jgi:hypothetical protein
MMNNEKLKPCPFCGAAPSRIVSTFDASVYARCPTSDCVAAVQSSPANVWNRRATPAPESALAESILAWWDDVARDYDGEAPAFVNLAMGLQSVPFEVGEGE